METRVIMGMCHHSWSFVRQYLSSDGAILEWPSFSINATNLPKPNNYFSYNDSAVFPRTMVKWESQAMAEVFGHWCRYENPSQTAHVILGTLLLVVGLTGIVGNGTVILVFIWYRRLRTPSNTLIVNLAISDLLMSALHPMASYSSFYGYWQFGRLPCDLYGAFCGLFGLVSIVSLSFLALERCLVISIKPWYGDLHVTKARVKGVALFTWFYCLLCVAPPFFGWGNYVPEGLLTSCSFDYVTRDQPTRLFFYFLFTLGFFLPLLVIVACYSAILITVFRHENNMIKSNIKNLNSTFKAYNQRRTAAGSGTTGKFGRWRKRSDFKSAEMILIIIGVFLLSWTPYAIVAMVGQFGDLDWLTPWVSYAPCVFAKMSTMYNPFIYGLSHQRFRSSLRHMMSRSPKANSVTFPAGRGRVYGGVDGDGARDNGERQISESQPSEKSDRTFRSMVRVKVSGTPVTKIISGTINGGQEVKEQVSAPYNSEESSGTRRNKLGRNEHFL